MADYDWFAKYEKGYQVNITFFFVPRAPQANVSKDIVEFLVRRALENDPLLEEVIDPRYVRVTGLKEATERTD